MSAICGRSPGVTGALLPAFIPPNRVLRSYPVNLLLVLIATVMVASPAYAESISPRRLVEVVDLGNPTISPDGRSVAYRTEQASIERNTYDTAWYVQSLDEQAAPRRVADGGLPLRQYTGIVAPAPAAWSPDGRWIYYRALIDGQIAVWRAATDGSGAKQVTFDPADVREFELGDDGRTLRYAVGATRNEVLAAEEDESDRGVLVDETVLIGASLVQTSQLEGHPATQRFVGDWFELGPLLAKTPDRWKEVDLATLTMRDLPQSYTPQSASRMSSPAKRKPAPRKWVHHPVDGRIAIVTRPGEGEGHYEDELGILQNLGSSHAVTCDADLCRNKSISDIQWRPNSDDVLFTVIDRREGRSQSVFRWNVSTGEVHPVVRTNGYLGGSSQRFYDVPCGLSSEALVCVTAEADRPPRMEAIDLESGRRRVIFDPNLALASDISATVPARLIRWSDAQGTEFTGWLFAARREGASKSLPLFVTLYTCDGFLRGGVGDEWPLASLAEHGISAACINGNPVPFDVEAYYGQGIRALTGLIQQLTNSGEIDPTKVGMGGLSHGTEVTMWTVMHSDLLSAASVTSPSVTPNWYLFNSLREGFRSVAASQWKLGERDETPERWRAVSPTFNLDKIKAPILFQMPEQEYVVALEYALPLVRRRLGDIYVFPGEPHIKFQPRHKLAAYERNLDWFRFWLQGYEDADPAKAGEYKRWRSMRTAGASGELDAPSHAP